MKGFGAVPISFSECLVAPSLNQFDLFFQDVLIQAELRLSTFPYFFTSFQQSQSAGTLSFGGNPAVFFKSVSGDITSMTLIFSGAATRHPIVVVLHVLNFQKFRTNGGKNNGWRSSKKH